MFKLEKKETKFLLICSLVLIFLTTISYLVGFIVADSSGSRYLGANLRYHVDVNVYQSYINQAKQGYIFFENLYTAEHQVRLFFNPGWIAIGLIAKICNVSSLLAFHLFRIFLIPIFVITSYIFIGRFVREITKKMIATIIFLFGGGLGLFFVSTTFSGTQPIDLWLPESNSFLSTYHSPHWLLSMILILIIYQLLLIYLEKGKKTYFLAAILLTITLGIIHPYDLTVIFVVCGYFIFYLGIKNKKIVHYLKKLLIFVLFSSLPLFYFLILKKIDPVFAAWFDQNITLSGSIGSTITSYGLLFLLLIPGFRIFFRMQNNDDNKFFILIWFLLNFILLYLPFVFIQRRLVLCFMFPISILATEGIIFIANKLKNIKMPNCNKIFIITILALLPITNLYLVFLDIVALIFYDQLPLYLDKDYVEALEFLNDNTSDEEIILACYNISNIIPGQIAHKVFSGHPHQTALFDIKNRIVEMFYLTNDLDYLKKQWLTDYGIDYIIYGPEEKKLQQDKIIHNQSFFNPEEKYYLEPVFRNNTVAIYMTVN